MFSRVWTLWAVMNVAPPAQTSIFLTFACTSWALVEVPRYLYYAFNLVGFVPYPIFWLRYRWIVDVKGLFASFYGLSSSNQYSVGWKSLWNFPPFPVLLSLTSDLTWFSALPFCTFSYIFELLQKLHNLAFSPCCTPVALRESWDACIWQRSIFGRRTYQ